MKTLLITDTHGKNPLPLIERKGEDGIGRVICLGDYINSADSLDTLAKLLDLEDTIVLPGNHDFAFMKEAVHPGSKFPEFLEVSEEEYKNIAERIRNTASLREYAERFIINTDPGRFYHCERVGEEDVFYTHAFPLEDNEGEGQHLWWRLHDPYFMLFDRKKINASALYFFEEMGADCPSILFRGHDHQHGLVSSLKRARNSLLFIQNHEIPKGKTTLNLNRKHIVTVGAFYTGHYAVYDTNSSQIEFCGGEEHG